MLINTSAKSPCVLILEKLVRKQCRQSGKCARIQNDKVTFGFFLDFSQLIGFCWHPIFLVVVLDFQNLLTFNNSRSESGSPLKVKAVNKRTRIIKRENC